MRRRAHTLGSNACRTREGRPAIDPNGFWTAPSIVVQLELYNVRHYLHRPSPTFIRCMKTKNENGNKNILTATSNKYAVSTKNQPVTQLEHGCGTRKSSNLPNPQCITINRTWGKNRASLPHVLGYHILGQCYNPYTVAIAYVDPYKFFESLAGRPCTIGRGHPPTYIRPCRFLLSFPNHGKIFRWTPITVVHCTVRYRTLCSVAS